MYEALVAIQKIGDPSAAPRISFLLRDLQESIQVTALETTGLLRNKEAEPQVRDALQNARTVRVRRAALGALAMLEAAIEAGALDVESDADGHEVTCAPEDFFAVRDALEARFGAPESAKLDWRPTTQITVSGIAPSRSRNATWFSTARASKVTTFTDLP